MNDADILQIAAEVGAKVRTGQTALRFARALEIAIRKKIVKELRSSAFLHTDVNKEHVLLSIEHGGTEWHKYVTPPQCEANRELAALPKANFMSGDKDALRVTPNDRRFAVVWPLDRDEAARKQFEGLASDSYGFKRSRKGTYVNASTARDWKWFRLGMRAS
jgi:hypothetical protein